MESNLTINGLAALFGTMLVLAAAPGVTVLVVMARSAALGFIHGVATTLGLVAGDVLFIFLAVFGLTGLGAMWGPVLTLIAHVGGLYLIVLGVLLLRAPPVPSGANVPVKGTSLWSSFMAGLLITLGDQKAILFYLGFLPAFVDIETLTGWDVGLLIASAATALFSVKLAYAWMGDRAAARINGQAGRVLSRCAALIMILVGVTLLIRT